MNFENNPIADRVEKQMRSLQKSGVKLNAGSEYNRVFEAFYDLFKRLDESEPSPVEDVQSNDMTAREFFDSPESPVTLDKICSPVEKEFLLDTIELYAKGKVHQALKATSTPPAKDNWVKIEYRLPEEEEWVLVHNQEVDDCPVTIGVYVNGRWRILELGVDVEQIVTHWQPLPTPPTT